LIIRLGTTKLGAPCFQIQYIILHEHLLKLRDPPEYDKSVCQVCAAC
jgi:hypothetical protein